jgi:hypothetical protein
MANRFEGMGADEGMDAGIGTKATVSPMDASGAMAKATAHRGSVVIGTKATVDCIGGDGEGLHRGRWRRQLRIAVA